MLAAMPPRRTTRSSTRKDRETLCNWSARSWSANRPGKCIRWSVAIEPVTATRCTTSASLLGGGLGATPAYRAAMERYRGDMGRRFVPHTADVRIEAWGASREECVAEAVAATVESFADVSGAAPASTEEVRFDAGTDEDLLVAVLDEVIYRLDTAGQLPLTTDVTPADGALVVRFTMADVAAATP